MDDDQVFQQVIIGNSKRRLIIIEAKYLCFNNAPAGLKVF